MVRPRAFDEAAVLNRAMEVFWSRGYGGTSLDDLCGATGLSRSSFYAALGDKRTVYRRVLELYEAGATERIRRAFAESPTTREAVSRFLEQLIESIVAGPGRRGCFIGNCAAELAEHDPEAARQVKRSLGRVEAAFRSGLEAARLRAELPPETNTRALARFLTAGIQGLRLVGKVHPDRRALADIANTLLRCLP